MINKLAPHLKLRACDIQFLLTEKGISYRYDLEQMAAAANMEIHSFLETGNTEVITKLLLQNAGISYLPEYHVKQFSDLSGLNAYFHKRIFFAKFHNNGR